MTAILILCTLSIVRLRRDQRTEAPPPNPDKLQVVSVQSVAGDAQAFRIVARMSRADGGRIRGAFETHIALHDSATGKQLLRRQCGFTIQDTPDGRSTEITLTDRLPTPAARPVQAQIWVQNRWVPPSERTQWHLWQIAGSLLPHPRPQSQPAKPLTCPVTLPVGGQQASPANSKEHPADRPRAVRSLLWRAPAGIRVASRGR